MAQTYMILLGMGSRAETNQLFDNNNNFDNQITVYVICFRAATNNRVPYLLIN